MPLNRDDIKGGLNRTASGTHAARAAAKQQAFYDRRLKLTRHLELQVNAGKMTHGQAHATLQRAGFIPGGAGFLKPHGVGGLAANLVADVATTAYGFPGGVKDTVTHPVRTAKAVGHQYAHTYGPALRGDWSTFGHRVYEHPLGPLLDAGSVFTAGAKAAEVVGLAERPALLRAVSADGGHVQPVSSPNPLTRRAEHVYDRFSNKHPNAPVAGAKDRISRRLPFELQREHERAVAPSADLQAATKKLNPAEKVAYAVHADYGEKAHLFIDREIAMRRERLKEHPKEAASQAGQIAMLTAARKHVLEPSPELQVALEHGRALSLSSRDKLIGLNQLSSTDAAERLHLHARLASGAHYVEPTPGKLGTPSQALLKARARVARLEALHERAVTKASAKAVPYGNVHTRTGFVKQDLKTAPEAALKRQHVEVAPGPKTLGVPSAMPAKGINTPTVERLGGALSVARDELARLESAAASRVKPTGLIGAEDVRTGEGAFYTPDAARPALRSIVHRTAAVFGKPRKIVHQNKGILFTSGRLRRNGPKLTLEDYARSARAESQVRDVERASTFAKPLNPEMPKGLDPGHRFFNPEGAKLPRRMTEAPSVEEILAMAPHQLAAALHDEHDALLRGAFPTEADLAQMPPHVRAKVKQIDEKIAGAFAERRFKAPTGPLARNLLKAYDTSNHIARQGLLYLKGGFIPANFIGDLGFLALQQGPHVLKNLVKATGKVGGLERATLRRLDLEVGNGPALAIVDHTDSPLGKFTETLAHASNTAASLLTRRAAILHELETHGFTTNAEIDALLKDPARRPLLNQISETAENAIIKYRGMSPDERAILARAFFPYAWVKGSTRYAIRLPLDRPVAADVATQLGNEGHDTTSHILGQVSAWLENVVPVGAAEHKLGIDSVPVVNAGSVTPFGTFADVIGTGKNIATGREPGRQASAFFAPPLRGLVDATTGYNSFLGRSYPAGTSPAKALYESTVGGFPAVRLVEGLAHPKVQTGPIEGPASRQPYFLPATSAHDARVNALKQFFLPSVANTRDLNLDAAHAGARAERRALMSPQERVDADNADALHKHVASASKLHQLGILPRADVPAQVTKAQELWHQRHLAYAKAGKQLTVKQKARIDVQVAMQHGEIPPNIAKTAVRLFARASGKTLERLRNDFWRIYGLGEVLTQWNGYVTAHNAG